MLTAKKEKAGEICRSKMSQVIFREENMDTNVTFQTCNMTKNVCFGW